MTSEQKRNLDKKISEFESFVEFHSYAYENDIIFDNEAVSYTHLTLPTKA